MKLTKDQKQKLALGAMIVIGVIYAYFEFLLGPLQRGRNAATSNVSRLEPKIQEARAQIAKTQQLKAREPQAKQVIEQVNAMIPQASPIAWFPPRLEEFFKRKGVEKVTTRLNTDAPDKELTGFKRLNWGVEAARVEFIPFAAAVAGLENHEPLIEIQSFEVEAGREDVGYQRAALILNNLSRQ